MGGFAVWQAGKSQKFTLLTYFCNLDDELLGDDAFVERMAGIEQQRQLAVARDFKVNLGDIAKLPLVCDDRNGTLVFFENAKRDSASIGQDRPMPAAWTERTDRRECEQI